MRRMAMYPHRTTRDRVQRQTWLGTVGVGVCIGALAAIIGGWLLVLLDLPADGWLAAALMLLAVALGGWIAASRVAGSGWKPGIQVGVLLSSITVAVALLQGKLLGLAGLLVLFAACAALGAFGGWLATLPWLRRRG